MQVADFKAFAQLLDDTYDLIGVGAAKVISPAAKALFFKDLIQYPLDYIEKALAAHRQDAKRGNFTPKPSDIIHQIERRMPIQWIPADEAWSMMPKVEADSGILNQATGPALAVALPLLAEGDDTAARMAFRAKYNRLVEQERLARRQPVHFLSPGKDQLAVEAMRAQGIEQGLLPAPANYKAIDMSTDHAALGRIQAMLTVKAIKDE